MDNSTIQTLETAGQMLMAPPNLVTSEQRHQAESVFLEFRSSKNPYEMCRELLEKSNSDYVLFEAASLLKSGLIREWNLLSESDISSLREYLLNYLLRKDSPPFLREKLLQTIAIIIKRGSIDDGGRERKALIGQLENIILSSPINQQKLACSLILAIMQEYAITVKSADVGLMWDVHFRLKKTFEASDLKRIFRFTVSVLQQIVRSGHQPEGEQAMLTKQLLMIVEAVLTWSHVSPLLSKRLIGAFEAIHESDSAPALRLGANWMDTIMQPELLSLFFEIHMYVRSNPELLNYSLTCLTQLASLSGYTDELKKQYFDYYVSGFLNAMAFINEPFDRELLGIADIYRRLNQFFRPAAFASAPPAFLQTLTKLTCHSIRGAVIEEIADEESVWRESLTKFLHTWSSVIIDCGHSNETLMNPCIEVFNTYLQCRLAPPDGTRRGDCSDVDIRDDMEEDERQLHSCNLMTIGAIARKAPAHCSHVLFSLLQDRSKRLESQLQQMHMGKLQLSSGVELTSLFEDLHWILMITGHFLAIDATEEESLRMVPTEIMEYSFTENADVERSLAYLTETSNDPENVDSIIKIVGQFIRISTWECMALNAGLGHVFSPELSATISWLLKIWAQSYLVMPSDYNKVSRVMESAFGARSPGVSWACGRLAARVCASLRHLYAQPPAAQHALKLLLLLASWKDTMLSQCEEFRALVEWEIAGNNLPGDLKRLLYKSFALVSKEAHGIMKTRLVESILALQDKLNTLKNMDLDTEPVRNMLTCILDCFIGFNDGFIESESMDQQFLVLVDCIEKIPGIIYKYHNYSSVVHPALELLSASARKMLVSIQPQNKNKFLEVCNTTFEVYQRWNSGKLSHIPQDAEEETYDDICSIMEITRKIACYSQDASGAETVARGLRVLFPLITPGLLSMPTLAHQTYKMLRVLEVADQLTILPQEDFNMVVSALRVGLTSVSSDVSSVCCNTIAGLADKLSVDSPYAMPLLTLAEILLMLIIKMEMPSDCIPAAGAAIYALTCLKPALLEGLARQMIEAFAVNDPANVPKLESAFGVLTNGVLFDRLRTHRIRFQDNFDKFLSSVHGFLLVK